MDGKIPAQRGTEHIKRVYGCSVATGYVYDRGAVRFPRPLVRRVLTACARLLLRWAR
jgi:hypothetical protein